MRGWLCPFCEERVFGGWRGLGAHFDWNPTCAAQAMERLEDREVVEP
jgi:hypothetical protein